MSGGQVPYRTITDVIAILDPRGVAGTGGGGNGRKRRRDVRDETTKEKESSSEVVHVDTDFGAVAARVLAGPPPAKKQSTEAEDEAGGYSEVGSGDGGAVEDKSKKTDMQDGHGEKSADEEEVSKPKEDEDTAAETNVTSSDRIATLRAQIEAVKADNEAINKRRKDVFLRYANLASVYNYGLSHIATLNDIAVCPDNTLPGNHPPDPPASSGGK